MANVPTVHSAAPRVPRAGLLVLAAAFAVAVLAASRSACSAQAEPDQSRPVPNHALAGSHDMTKAFAELAQRAGVDAALPAAPWASRSGPSPSNPAPRARPPAPSSSTTTREPNLQRI